MTRKKSRGTGIHLDPLKIAAFALLGLAALTGFGLASLTRDPFTEGVIALVRRLFGGGIYATPIALGILGFWLLAMAMGRKPWLSWRRPMGALLLFLVSLPALHLLSMPEDARLLASEGGGGGYAGWLLSEALMASLSTVGAYVALILVGALGLILLSGVSLTRATEVGADRKSVV